MAGNQDHAPSPPLGLPFPWDRGTDVAFVPSPGYSTDLPGPTRPRLADAGPAAEPLVRGPLPPVAQPPPVGGFDPRLITDVDRAAKYWVPKVLDYVRDAWGYWNRRNGTQGTDASYSRGAYTGSYNPNSTNTFDLMVDGYFYEYETIGGVLLPLKKTYRNQIHMSHANVPAGRFVYVDKWPYTETITSGGIQYEIYNNDYGFNEIELRYLLPGGTTLPASKRGADMWAADVKWTMRVTPTDPVGAVPYFPDIPATPFTPDPAGGNPYIDPGDIPTIRPADAPRVNPFPIPLPAPRPTPATAPPDARPLVEEAPTIGGAARQVTNATGLLPRLAPQLVPQIVPIPARPIPGYLPQLTPQGEPQLAPAPAPQPTATDQRQYGPRTVTGTGVRPDLAGIAEEVGRIEMKLAMVLGSLDSLEPPLEPPYIYGPGVYTLEPVCDFDSQGVPMPAREASWPGGLGEVSELSSKIDALAELLQHHKELKQPICKRPPPSGQPVTVTFEEEPA